MISTNEFKSGAAILVDGALYVIVEFQHVKPGKGGAFVRTKLRRLKSDAVIERTFRAGDKFQDAFIENRKLQFLYRAGDQFHFMDMKSYEEISLTAEAIGKSAGFLKENMEIEGEFYESDLIGLTLPVFVDLRIVETEPGIRGDTSKSGNKPAKLETGMVVQVPLFVGPDETIRVDTRTGTYSSRA
ncbi:MAG: elongation factor P [Candidatus Omnitrophica bacterium]|nr:elongation factor P [Candidatus Omnitrophota bacterium]